MTTAGFRCPTGFMHYGSDLPGSTDSLTPAATRSGSEDGRMTRPRCCPPMTANESSPPEGESADGESSSEYVVSELVKREEGLADRVAQDLLSIQLVQVYDPLSEALHSVSVAAEDGELTEEDVSELVYETQRLNEVVELAAQLVGRPEGTVKEEAGDDGGVPTE